MNQKKENTNTRNYFRPQYLLFLLTLVFSFFLSSQAFASTYYVATTGLDTNAGTLALPFKTIQKAADIVNAGDTVIVEDGVYTAAAGTSFVTISRSGNASNYITIKSHNKWGAVLDGQNNTAWGGMTISGSYINVEGFEMKEVQERFFIVTGSYINVREVNLHHNAKYCSDTTNGLSAFSIIGANYLTVEKSLIHDIGRYAPGEGGCSPLTTYYKANDHGFYVSGSANLTFKNNLFYNINHGFALQVYSGAGATSSNVKFINNTMKDGNPWHPAGHVILWGNLSGGLIANNIFYNQLSTAIQVYQGSYTYSNVEIKNNITYGGTGIINTGTATGVTISNNFDNTDPKMTNPSGLDFTLQSSSPAIDTGITSADVMDDYNGLSRPKGIAYDIGAYEYQGVVTPTIYTISYTAGTGGTISGTLSQTVSSGTNGTSVTAVPSSGYTFVNWSDGITTASRTETNVTANKSVFANFTLVLNNIHYISPSGLDTNTGTTLQPWKTLAYACAHATTSGDIIHINAGNYYETSRCDLSVGVSIVGEGDSSHIVSSYYLADSNYGAISLHSTAAGTNGNQSISYIKLDGNNLTSYCGIAVYRRSNVHIDHVTIVDFLLCGINLRGDAITSSLSDPGSDPSVYQVGNEVSNSTIINCSDGLAGYSGLIKHDSQDGLLIHDNILTQNSRPDGHNGDIIAAWGGHDKNVKYYKNIFRKPAVSTVTWNFNMEIGSVRGGVEIYNNEFWGGVGIDLAAYNNIKGASTYSCWIHNNLFDSDYKISSTENPYDPYFAITVEGGNEDVIVSNNLVRNKPGGFSFVLGQTPRTFKNIQVYNNVEENMGYADGGWSVANQISSYSTGNTIQDIYFYNNSIILNQSKTAFWIASTDNVSNIYFKNNIVKNIATGVGYGWLAFSSYDGIIDKIYMENNLVYNNSNNNNPYYYNGKVVTNVSEINTIKLDPLFNSSTDLHLQSTSPAINTGTTLSSVSNDYDGNFRPSGNAYDIGAYEYQGVSAPTTYTISYSANTGGTISGTLSQTVSSGSNGTSVTAVPSSGYTFVNWSDGITTASRTETNVTANKTITASFTIIPTSGGGGGGGGGGSVIPSTTTPVTSITPVVTTPNIQPSQDKGCNPGNTFSITTGKLCPKTNTPLITTLKLIKTVRYGSRLNDRNEVKILQQILIAKGYLTGTADGIFGRATLAAVKAFQTANGLKADGVVGAGTREGLNR